MKLLLSKESGGDSFNKYFSIQEHVFFASDCALKIKPFTAMKIASTEGMS